MAVDQVSGQAGRMRRAMTPVLEMGPSFLSGVRDADTMANTMVAAVQSFVDAERALGENATGDAGAGPAASADLAHTPQQLEAALTEMYVCGSGYLAGRCDAACVARTMTQLVGEFA